VERINNALAGNKITFAPGSNAIDASAREVLDTIADILKECEEVEMAMEIGGHTDSQGRESMNLELSQQRAEAVLEALLTRRVLTTNLTAQGYGEEFPIADNGTEAGREANRRIEFKLILPEEPQGAEAEAEAGAGDVATAAEPEAPAAAAEATEDGEGSEGSPDEQN
jgi:OOP family OmpA-OmpF porin